MATTASIPPYMLPGVTVQQPSHLEGDSNLATEILPGPPSIASVQQAAQKRDPRKPSTVFSYLPPSDPGSTYSGIMHGTLIGQEPQDGPRTKRSRVDKGSVFLLLSSVTQLTLASPCLLLFLLQCPFFTMVCSYVSHNLSMLYGKERLLAVLNVPLPAIKMG